MGNLDNIKKMVSDYQLEVKQPVLLHSKVNFDEWRDKIKDPKFVDQVEADFHADVDIANSFVDPYQHFGWSEEGKAERRLELNEKCKKYNVPVPTKEKLPKNKEEHLKMITDAAENVGSLDQHFDEIARELRLDYEQVEAERDMFGLKGEMMDYALHPQFAELQEEYAAGKQTFVDKVLYEFEYSRYHKRERLLQLQDETQRQIFLERHKLAIKFHGINAA